MQAFNEFAEGENSLKTPMVKYLKRFKEFYDQGNIENIPRDASMEEGNSAINVELIPVNNDHLNRDYSMLTDYIKSTMTCDEVLSLYLFVVSK